MVEHKNIQDYIAIVPARSGSKGIRNKNLLEINGKTLLEIAVESGLDCAQIRDVVVTSDSKDYLASLNSNSKKLIKLLRDPKAALDTSTANEVVMDVLEKLPQKLDTNIIYLQPTSPLRTSNHVTQAIKSLELSDCHSLVSVVKSSESPFKAITVTNSVIDYFSWTSEGTINRQELPLSYRPNGAIYISSCGIPKI